MRKFRRRLEKQKAVLSQRLRKKPEERQVLYRRSMVQRRFNPKSRQKLLFARADHQLKEVVDAIERLDDGIYGLCVVCGEQIEMNRLKVLPTVTHCWRCQQEKS